MISAREVELAELEGMREKHRREMNCQVVHDSIHRRAGWAREFLLEADGTAVGYGSVAEGGPWKDKPTFFEFFILPESRGRVFECFEIFVAASGAQFLEVQTNATLATVMALTYGRDLDVEAIVFRDELTTRHLLEGAVLKRVTTEEEIREAMERRQGGGEWVLELGGEMVAKGGILFHYNVPYGDIYMEVMEPFRRRGIGAYIIQELKRACYELGAVPAARCNRTNEASRRTLQKAGFVPYANILTGGIRGK